MSNRPSLRDLPSITALLNTAALKAAIERHGRAAVTEAARSTLAVTREGLKEGPNIGRPVALNELAQRIADDLALRESAALRPVINATGVLLHTGLGRAPLAPEAARAAAEAAAGYCSVELDLATGERSNRSHAVADLLRVLTGAEAAHVVNNNAGALALSLGALAAGKEIIVSHGELIEIGGGFRLPEVIETFGARLRAVGTTNKTRVEDYAQAIGHDTAVLLAVHPSNFRVTGFAASPRIEELAKLARDNNLPLVYDIGSGALVDFAEFGFPDEPIASRSIAAGADLVMFSGDKLLGGPQCGIIVGRKDLVERVMRHPLNRALRVDKMTLAALRATLALYQHGLQALETVPLLRLLTAKPQALRDRAERLAERLRASLVGWEVAVIEDQAYLGGGTTPEQALPSWSVAMNSESHRVEDLARALRLGCPAVVPRVQEDQLILCLHGLLLEADATLGASVEAAVGTLALL